MGYTNYFRVTFFHLCVTLISLIPCNLYSTSLLRWSAKKISYLDLNFKSTALNWNWSGADSRCSPAALTAQLSHRIIHHFANCCGIPANEKSIKPPNREDKPPPRYAKVENAYSAFLPLSLTHKIRQILKNKARWLILPTAGSIPEVPCPLDWGAHLGYSFRTDFYGAFDPSTTIRSGISENSYAITLLNAKQKVKGNKRQGHDQVCLHLL